jgi:hypothetical protein
MVRRGQQLTNLLPKEGKTVKKKNPTKKDREILSSVKREMQESRQTTSVREALAAAAALAARALTIHPAKA